MRKTVADHGAIAKDEAAANEGGADGDNKPSEKGASDKVVREHLDETSEHGSP